MEIKGARRRLAVCALGLFGVAVLAGGSLFLVFFKPIIRFFLRREMILKEEYELFQFWKTTPIPTYQKIYVFNITNPVEVTKHGSKPIVKEIGPYVFQGNWRKEELSWNDEEGTVTYNDVKEYVFDPELSVGDQEEMIYTLNGPLLGVVNYVEDIVPYFLRPFVVPIVNGIFESYNETLLIHRSVREVVYEGYYEPMVEDLINVVEPFITLSVNLINNTFGVLHERKEIGDGVFSVMSGVKGLDDYAAIKKWNNQSSLNWWNGEYCNQINGTDGVQYAPGVSRNQTLYFFNPHLCRSFGIRYERDITVHGIPTYRFSLPSDTLASAAINPSNKCFCSVGRHCDKSGLFPLSTCKRGAPYLISLPHFFEADSDLQTSLEGVKPIAEKHKSYIDVEPISGLTLNAAVRFQLNGDIKQNSAYDALMNVQEAVVPVIWISEEATLNPYFANYFKSRLLTPVTAAKAIAISAVALGVLWVISSAVFIFFIRGKIQHLPMKNSFVLRTLQSVYTSVALWPPTEEESKEAEANSRLMCL